MISAGAVPIPARRAFAPTRSPVRLVLGIAVAIVVLVAAVDQVSPRAVGVLLVLILLAPFIISMPLRGLQVLLAASVAIEIFPLGYADSFTDQVPFFLNLNNSLGVNLVSITPAELLMLLLLAVAFARSDPMVRARLLQGRLFGAYLLFLLAVLLGEVHGLLNGGDLNKSLWELRPQVYGFVAFVAASLLIQSRDDLVRLIPVVVAAVLVKAAIADIRYFFVINRNLGTHDGVLGHEDSFFLSVLLLGALASFVWQGWTPNLKPILLVAALAFMALLANERRAGIAALAGGVGVIVLLAIRYHPTHRRRILLLTALAAAGGIAFLIVFWNHQTGVIGQLVRPIHSQFDPTYRDYLSNIYRQAEDINLKLSFQTNKVIGMGFGMPFLVVITQADISSVYPLWNYIPHNTLLWVGVRMGLVGSVAFWGLIAMAVLEVCRLHAVQRDRFLLMVGSLIGGVILAELLVAYTDLQLESYRNMIFIGVLFGILNVIPALFPEPVPEKHAFA